MRRWTGAAGASLLLLLAAAPAVVRAQVAQPEPLQRRLTIRFDRIELGAALTRLRSIYGVPLAFSPDAVPAGHVVTASFDEQPVAQILAQVLAGTGLRVITIGGGTIVVAPGFPTTSTEVVRPLSPDVAT